MSKIIKLEANNFKRLRAVEISPDGNLVVIAGRNGQGKTSVLDAITAALGGNSSKALPRPIRDGEDKASIVLETEELIVTRTFSGGTSKLTVKSKDGATFSKGQAKLDQLLGRLSLDPLAFTQLSEKDQLKTLLDLVDLPFKPADIEAERAKVFAERTDVNRWVKELQGQAAGYSIPASTPDEEVSVSALLSEYREAQQEHARRARMEQERDAVAEKVHRLQDRKEELLAELRRVDAEQDDAQQEHLQIQEAIEQVRLTSAPDLEAIQSQIDTAEQVNAAVREKKQAGQVAARLTALQSDAKELTEQLEAIDKRKADGLAAATFPVDGLGFDADGVTYQGIPFKQASGAEQLRVSLAMAIALNPGLRVIRIADGSLLDSTNLQLIEDMAVAHDYQVWIEMVNESGDFGIVIEDGEVAA
ncbi:AAA family ATPase [Arthrobacter sp. zg-Y859]|uniref:AAA family ATPase n=1 Tax=Arthrobacter jinronghuae TaxID=2964609 RepID=A0ABT1NVG0_9MICC|nr:AAA family ATPase [Arthrobacter jinronghuae]MCQ1951586.1 AAA family ATPase [Arthrobacter jinronghuae]UWX79699.1 AAA family ATPase [Arthrobacter jinronghuae]